MFGGRKKLLLVLVAAFCLLFAAFGTAACKDNTTENDNKYTVTFMADGEVYDTVEVSKNRLIRNKPTDPVFEDGRVFTGWFRTEDFTGEWNFSVDIVTENMTLYAGYRTISEYPSELAMAAEACTSKLTWTQAAASPAENYTVTLTDKAGQSVNLTGSVAFDEASFVVTFTPSAIPQGGYRSVTVTDSAYEGQTASADQLLFGGAGTQSNPYLIGSALDFTKVNGENVSSGTYFSMAANITLETSRAAQRGFEFNGVLDGAGRTITFENANSAAIYKIGENGVVKNLNIAGKITSTSFDSIGTVADFNAGRVESVNVTANVESTSGSVGSNGFANALNEALEDGNGARGIAGGVVGTNEETGVVYDCKIVSSSSATGVVKAGIGGGCIVGYNKGLVELCVSEGCLGAYNSVESGGKSLSNYSYGGGVVGINAGIVTKCATEGSGKLLAQRYEDAGAVVAGTTNSYLGGIVGYNLSGATVSLCSFSGIRVHGDENVGGIAGANAGTITDCMAEGIYKSTPKIVSYVGGRTNVGGIVGLDENGSVDNCVVTVNVFCFTEGTGYAVAKTANSSVYLSANPNAKSLAENPAAVALTEPQGANNQKMEIAAGSYDGKTENVLLGESFLGTINGNNAFVFDGTTIKLNVAYAEEETIEVILYNGGEEWKTVTVAETPSVISGPSKSGYRFTGWALTEGGTIAFAAGVGISLYDLLDVTADGTAKLYACFEQREETGALYVAVYDRYIGAAQGDKIKEDYISYLGVAATYEINFVHFEGDKLSVADFGAQVNAYEKPIDVIIGSGTNIATTGGVSILTRAAIAAQFETAEANRQAALLTDTEYALAFYSYITGIENHSATVTVVGKTAITTEINTLLGVSAEIPEVEVPAGYVQTGWATSENAAEAEIEGNTITYEKVASLLVDGKVTLYPVFAAQSYDLVVAIYTTKDATSTPYITTEEVEAVKNGFAAYLAANGKAALNVRYLIGSEMNNDGFNQFVLNDGTVDVVISGNKMDNDTHSIVLDDKYGKASVLEGMFENTSRKVGVVAGCANRDNAVLFYSYMTGTPEPDEPASTVLRVGYYFQSSNPITEAELAAVKAAFEAANEGITIEWAEYKYSKSSFTINDMIKDINAKNSDADETNNIDCLVNFGKNATTATETGSEQTLRYVNNVQVGTRYVLQLNDSAAAAAFYAFAQNNETLKNLGAAS